MAAPHTDEALFTTFLLNIIVGGMCLALGLFMFSQAEGEDVLYWLGFGMLWVAGVLTTIGSVGAAITIARR